MSKEHITAKERETRKVTILLHGALTTVLNGLDEKDYQHILVSTNSNNLGNIIFDEQKFIEQFKLVFQNDDRKLTVFDKALCLAMALERNIVITTNNLKGRIPKRLTNLNEKLITEVVLGYIGHSSYNVKHTDIGGNFNLDGFYNGHKKELKHMKEMLTEEFVNINFDYNKCLALLYEIYLRNICYLHDLPSEEIYNLKSKIAIKEKYDTPVVNVKEDNTYSKYRKTFRNMK